MDLIPINSELAQIKRKKNIKLRHHSESEARLLERIGILEPELQLLVELLEATEMLAHTAQNI